MLDIHVLWDPDSLSIDPYVTDFYWEFVGQSNERNKTVEQATIESEIVDTELLDSRVADVELRSREVGGCDVISWQAASMKNSLGQSRWKSMSKKSDQSLVNYSNELPSRVVSLRR